MRLILSLILTMGIADTTLAHTGDGLTVAALSHQLVGLHHLPLTVLLFTATGYLVVRWQRSKRAD